MKNNTRLKIFIINYYFKGFGRRLFFTITAMEYKTTRYDALDYSIKSQFYERISFLPSTKKYVQKFSSSYTGPALKNVNVLLSMGLRVALILKSVY